MVRICQHLAQPPSLEDPPLSSVSDYLFNIFPCTLRIGGRSPIRKLRTRHAVVTGTHVLIFIYDAYMRKHRNFPAASCIMAVTNRQTWLPHEGFGIFSQSFDTSLTDTLVSMPDERHTTILPWATQVLIPYCEPSVILSILRVWQPQLCDFLFKSWNLLKIVGGRMVTWKEFHIVDAKI
jgi:hypothetical protein